MKRFLSLLTAVLLVISMIPVISLAAETGTVYLDPVNGADTNSGLTEAAPVQSLEAAYAALSDADQGAIQLQNTLTLTEATTFPTCSIPVTITGGEIATASHLLFAGDTTLENMKLTLTASNSTTYISSEGHKLTIGEGITCTNTSYRFCLTTRYGEGSVDGAELTVKSGSWNNVFAAGYKSTTTGNATLTMLGGQVKNLLTPTYSGVVNGNVTMNLWGGTIQCAGVAPNTTGAVNGNVDMNLGNGVTINKVRVRRHLGSAAVNGTATVTVDGDCSGVKTMIHENATGKITKTRLVLKSGTFAVTPCTFDEVSVEIPTGKTLTLKDCDITADTVASAGTLRFTGKASLNAAAINGSLDCRITDTVQADHAYVTAPAGSSVNFPPATQVVEENGLWKYSDSADPGAFDTVNFKGLVLYTTADNISVKLYEGNTDDAPVMTPVYTEGKYAYYEVVAGGRYYYRARPASGNSHYNIRKNIYISEEKANTKVVLDVTPHIRSAAGWDTYETVACYSDEAMAAAFPSAAEMWPEYAELFTTPVFTNPRNPHQQTTQTEMMDYINVLDSADDDMYVFVLGKSGGRKASEYFDIPVVFFSKTDLSSATTWEEAAAMLRENGKLTFLYQAQIHGKETGAGEAAFAMLKHLDGDYGDGLLPNMNICVIPRLNTWGAYRSDRSVYTTGEIDANRDYMALESAEVQLTVKLYNHLEPELFYDAHECFVHPEYEQVGMHDVWSSVNFVPFTTQEFKATALTLASKIFERAAENNLTYGWYSSSVNGYNTVMGTTNLHVRGSLVFLTESQGILGGNQQLERRMMAHISTVTGVLDYVNANIDAVQKVVDDQRADIISRGRTYEESDVIVLQTGSTVHPEQNISGKQVDTCSGEITDTVFTGKTYDVVKKSRTAPTAYVIPAGEDWTADVLALLDKQGIAYKYIPEGATLPLQQYTGTTSAASLTEETTVFFPNGAYVMTMAQRNAYILGLLMEPDVKDLASYSGTLAQQGRITAVNGAFPTYRYIHDLNEEDFVDYTIVEIPAKEITLYVDNTNGLDTNDGLTESTPVKTLEQAYSLINAALADGGKGSNATLVIAGLYELGASTYQFPASNFPVTITGKTAEDGFSFTGGTGDAQIDRAIHLNGDTTFRNMKLHVNNSYAYNYIFANGHKLVLGTGLNTTTNKTNYYFAVSGGSVDYGDKVASVDVTIRSGSWKMIYLGGYYGDVEGSAKLDISGAKVMYSIVSSYRGNVGSLQMKIADTAVTTYKPTDTTHGIFAGTYTANSKVDSGKVLGDVTIALGKNVTAPGVFGTARLYGHVYGDTTIIADGVDLTKAPVKARYSGLSASYATGYVELELAEPVTADITVDPALTLDLGGCDITGNLTVDGTLTVKDSATDDYDVSDGLCGEITGNVTGTLVAAEGYLPAAKGFHRFDQYIRSVNLRPGDAGIYYSAAIRYDEVLAEEIDTCGVAVSLADLPGSDFETDEDTLYAEGTNGVLIQNILTGDSEDADRGIMDIYAASYVKLKDGTVLVSDENVAYSLYDVLLLVKKVESDALDAFLTQWNIESWFN